tara:strand:- start:506 stop:1546 length:1041 start_codon:yes stop_codon:yes gene_type:complete
MEDKSREVLKGLLPEEWVIRDYKPDYGIDIAVELFQYVDEERTKADTLGETFFGQIKSTHKVQTRSVSVHPLYNVEKKPLTENPDESKDITVIPLTIEVGELLTVQAMSPALPVVLFLVELNSGRVFFVCLNDLIDKVVLPSDPTFSSKGNKTIWIPIENELTLEEHSLTALKFYAKRPKLYAAFTKFTYQEHELRYLHDHLSYLPIEELIESAELLTIRHFLRGILEYDFWETTPMWTPIADCHRLASRTANLIDTATAEGGFTQEMFPDSKKLSESMQEDEEFIVRTFLTHHLVATWSSLKNLANMHEEICREWNLPTFMGHNLSYDHLQSGVDNGDADNTEQD